MITRWWFATHLKKYFVSIWNHHPDIPRLLSTISLSVQSSFFGRCDPNSFRVGDSFTAFRKDVRKTQWIYQSNPWTDFYFGNPFLIFGFLSTKMATQFKHSNDMPCSVPKIPILQWLMRSPHWQLQSWSSRQRPVSRFPTVFEMFSTARPFPALHMYHCCYLCSFCAQLQWFAGNPGFFKMELSCMTKPWTHSTFPYTSFGFHAFSKKLQKRLA